MIFPAVTTTAPLSTNVAAGDPNHHVLHNEERQGVNDALGLVPAITVAPSTTLLFDGTNGGAADSLGRQQVNSAQWTYDLGGGETPIGSYNRWGNWEAQVYTNRLKNCFVRGGKLYIKAYRESPQIASTVAGEGAADYSSARIHTQGKVAIPAGSYWEARISFPTTPGVWPAFWAMGVGYVRNADNTGNWPQYGEIDTVEAFGQHAHTAGFALHLLDSAYTPAAGATDQYAHDKYVGWDNSTALYEDPYFDISKPTYYGVWNSGTEIRRYINHVETFRYTQAQATADGRQWPFNADQFLILNMAVGGQSQGSDATSFVEAGMGATMVVEPVNIWTGVTDPASLGLQ